MPLRDAQPPPQMLALLVGGHVSVCVAGSVTGVWQVVLFTRGVDVRHVLRVLTSPFKMLWRSVAVRQARYLLRVQLMPAGP